MMCPYDDGLCLNPFCALGCIERKNAQRHEERVTEIIADTFRRAASALDHPRDRE
jgi:hypothetical protein